jgi:16S rRNA (cytidine1402-2'-O)-methyltransferase
MPQSLHLIPVSLGESPVTHWLPPEVQKIAGTLDYYIAENAKTARAFLKLIKTEKPMQEITIHALSRTTDAGQIRLWLKQTDSTRDIGLVSEAGCPAVADPGALVVQTAHEMGVRVVPWTGPSSIILGLMASGLNGQNFTFHGYAPVAPAERAQQLRTWEIISRKNRQTQIFIETPYRNNAMFDALLQSLNDPTRLCVARALTTNNEWIQTLSISEWKKRPAPTLQKQPTLFLFQA